jgi:hypothetical protein
LQSSFFRLLLGHETMIQITTIRISQQIIEQKTHPLRRRP